MNRALLSVCTSLVILTCILTAACGANSSAPPITVVITSPTTAPTIAEGQTVNITASTSGGNNAAALNTNVTWSLSGSGCTGGACGSLANETASSVTYTAPASLSSNINVLVRATSVANPSESNSIGITVAAISVTIQNKINELAAGTGQNFFTRFIATVQNDPASGGVTWALTAGGAPCSPACGTLSLSGPQGGQYVPPSTVPAAPDNTPTVSAVSVSNPAESDADTFTIFDGATACAPGGNEGLLNGEYAIMLQGWIGNGTNTPLLLGASFAADGTGKVTSGQDQINPFFKESYAGASLIPSASSYSVGPDDRGCLALTDQSDTTFMFHFSLGGVTGGVASKGDIILFTQQSATPERAAGILRLQDPTAFSLSSLAPNYALGVDGWANTSSGPLARFALAGSFAQNAGALSSPVFDSNIGGQIQTQSQEFASLGNITSISTGTGEATATLNLPLASQPSASVTVYVINSSELFLISDDLLANGTGAAFSGLAVATPGSFTAASILPSYIFRFTGISAGAATASVGLAGFSGGGLSGPVSGSLNQYGAGVATNQNLGGSYGLTGFSGRLVITGSRAATSPVCYLTSPVDNISALCVSTDATAGLGVFSAQPAATYGDGSLSGNFLVGSNEPADSTVPAISGVASVSSGTLTGTEDTSAPSGLSLGSPFTATLSINPNGTGSLGANTVAVTNGTQLYFINEISGTPAEVQVLDQQ